MVLVFRFHQLKAQHPSRKCKEVLPYLPHDKVEVALADFVLMADVELEGGGVGAYLVEEFYGWAEGA
jgi:hypothetical protein